MTKFVLLAYPRSGISWLRYIYRELLHLPPVPSHEPDTIIEPICKRHWIDEVEHNFMRDFEIPTTLILLIRNYKECIVRHNQHIKNTYNFNYSLSLTYTLDPAVSYMHPIHYFHHYDGDKSLIYYEDLIDYPLQTIENISNMMGVDSTQFVKLLKGHEILSKELYCSEHNTIQSNNTIHHSLSLSKMQKQEWDDTIKLHFPDYFELYLKRYAEKDEQ